MLQIHPSATSNQATCWRHHLRRRWSCPTASDHQAGYHAPSRKAPSRRCRSAHLAPRSDHRKPQTSNCSLFAISTDFKPFSLFGGSLEDTCRCNIGGQAGCWTWVADFTGYLPPFTTRNHPRYAQKYQKPNRAVLKPWCKFWRSLRGQMPQSWSN